jgi:hypothetical protein
MSSRYSEVDRSLNAENQQKVSDRESQEKAFTAPEDFGSRLKNYLDQIYFLRTLFRRGVGWRLTTSNKEFFYQTSTGRVLDKIPDNFDVVISLPDLVLSESLDNNVLTDLGITMFIKVDSRVSDRKTYAFFLLMGIHDYGHFNSTRDFARFARFYAPYFLPAMLRLKWLFSGRPSDEPPEQIAAGLSATRDKYAVR